MRILFLDILTDDQKLRSEINKKIYKGKSYSEAVRTTFNFDKKGWAYCDASKTDFPKSLKRFDAVVIGGSTKDPLSGQEETWMKKTYLFIRRLIKNKKPILGICGGLQFVARALGKKVILNPRGKEFGAISVRITKEGREDPLFKNLPRSISVYSSHKCTIESFDKKWALLASSKTCGFQSFAVGDRIRLTQFHPEMSTKHIRALAKMRRQTLNQTLDDRKSAGKQIIRNFLGMVGKIDKKRAPDIG